MFVCENKGVMIEGVMLFDGCALNKGGEYSSSVFLLIDRLLVIYMYFIIILNY